MGRDKRAIHEQWRFFDGPGERFGYIEGYPKLCVWLSFSWLLALLAQRLS